MVGARDNGDAFSLSWRRRKARRNQKKMSDNRPTHRDIEAAWHAASTLQETLSMISDDRFQRLKEKYPDNIVYGTLEQVATEIQKIDEVFTMLSASVKTCVHCGQSCFVNRIPVLDSYDVRAELYEHPLGEYICSGCEAKAQEEMNNDTKDI